MWTHLAPHQHGSKDNLQAVKEVVADDDDSGTPCGPAFAGADGFDAGGGYNAHTHIHTHNEKINQNVTNLNKSSAKVFTDIAVLSPPLSLLSFSHTSPLFTLPGVGGKRGILIRVIIRSLLLNITPALCVRAAVVRLFYDTWQSVQACKCQVC